MPIFREMGDRRGEATTLSNIGAVHNALRNPEKALEFYSQALPVFNEIGDRRREAAALGDIGDLMNAFDQLEVAFDISQVVESLRSTSLEFEAHGKKESAEEARRLERDALALIG